MTDEQDEFVKEIREREERIESQLKRREDWLVLRDLAERIFVADYPVACVENSAESIAKAAFMAAEDFIAEANKRAPK